MMQRSSSLLLLLVCTACLLLIPGCLAVRYEGAKADYMNNDIKAFRLDDVEWMIYKDEKTGMAYFYNSQSKGVQWSDPRPTPATSWADTWHIITACAFVPPLIFMVALGLRVWYIKETAPGLLNPTKERKMKKAHWPRNTSKPVFSRSRKSGRPTK